jgi:hypothetical protein
MKLKKSTETITAVCSNGWLDFPKPENQQPEIFDIFTTKQ